MKTRSLSSTLILAAIFLAALSVVLIGLALIPWSSLPMVAGCYIVGGIVVLAFRDYSHAPSYHTTNVHRLTAEDHDGARGSAAATVELRAA